MQFDWITKPDKSTKPATTTTTNKDNSSNKKTNDQVKTNPDTSKQKSNTNSTDNTKPVTKQEVKPSEEKPKKSEPQKNITNINSTDNTKHATKQEVKPETKNSSPINPVKNNSQPNSESITKDSKLTMKELIDIYRKSQNVDKDSILIYPQILSPFQRTSTTKYFSKIKFETAPCGNSNLEKFDKTLVTVDQSKNLNIAYQIHGEFKLNQNFKSTDPDIIFKKPTYPRLKCRIKLYSGNELSTEQYYLSIDYYVKYNLNKVNDKYKLEEQNSDMDKLTQFDCSNAINNTSVMKVPVPEIECSPCTLSLEVQEPLTKRSFQNCSDLSIVNPDNVNSNTCVNKCLNRGVCMNNRCHCEFFYRGIHCESYIGSATFRAIFQFLFYVLIVAIFAVTIYKWREITCAIPEWIRNLNVGPARGYDQLNEEDN